MLNADGPRYFPNPCEANSDGLLVVDSRLDCQRLMDAYCHGIFPWPMYAPELLDEAELDETDNDNPGWIVGWYSPDPRAVLRLSDLRIPRRLQRKLNSQKFRFSFNRQFAEVIEQCATVDNRGRDTWLMLDLVERLKELHERNIAMSLEVFCKTADDWELCGGLYGVVIGPVFCAESMFHTESDASKAALCVLVELLRCTGFKLIDIQISSDVLTSLGATEIPRAEFQSLLKEKSRVGELASLGVRLGSFHYRDVPRLSNRSDFTK